jgi:hypothetical protein
MSRVRLASSRSPNQIDRARDIARVCEAGMDLRHEAEDEDEFVPGFAEALPRPCVTFAFCTPRVPVRKFAVSSLMVATAATRRGGAGGISLRKRRKTPPSPVSIADPQGHGGAEPAASPERVTWVESDDGGGAPAGCTGEYAVATSSFSGFVITSDVDGDERADDAPDVDADVGDGGAYDVGDGMGHSDSDSTAEAELFSAGNDGGGAAEDDNGDTLSSVDSDMRESADVTERGFDFEDLVTNGSAGPPLRVEVAVMLPHRARAPVSAAAAPAVVIDVDTSRQQSQSPAAPPRAHDDGRRRSRSASPKQQARPGLARVDAAPAVDAAAAAAVIARPAVSGAVEAPPRRTTFADTPRVAGGAGDAHKLAALPTTDSKSARSVHKVALPARQQAAPSALYVRVLYVDLHLCVLRRCHVTHRADSAADAALAANGTPGTAQRAAVGGDDNNSSGVGGGVVSGSPLRVVGDVISAIQERWRTPPLVAARIDRAVVTHVLLASDPLFPELVQSTGKFTINGAAIYLQRALVAPAPSLRCPLAPLSPGIAGAAAVAAVAPAVMEDSSRLRVFHFVVPLVACVVPPLETSAIARAASARGATAKPAGSASAVVGSGRDARPASASASAAAATSAASTLTAAPLFAPRQASAPRAMLVAGAPPVLATSATEAMTLVACSAPSFAPSGSTAAPAPLAASLASPDRRHAAPIGLDATPVQSRAFEATPSGALAQRHGGAQPGAADERLLRQPRSFWIAASSRFEAAATHAVSPATTALDAAPGERLGAPPPPPPPPPPPRSLLLHHADSMRDQFVRCLLTPRPDEVQNPRPGRYVLSEAPAAAADKALARASGRSGGAGDGGAMALDALLLPALSPGCLVRWWQRRSTVAATTLPAAPHSSVFHDLDATLVCRIVAIYFVESAAATLGDAFGRAAHVTGGFSCPVFTLVDVVGGRTHRNVRVWPIDLQRLE